MSLTVNVPVDWAARPASTASALPPQRMTYQGYVTDGSGGPIGTNGPVVVNMVFRIFDAATGGNAVWAERQALAVEQGYFSAQLGEGSPVEGVSNAPGGLSDVFTGQVVSPDRITDYAGDPAHRVWVGDKLYGWAFPV